MREPSRIELIRQIEREGKPWGLSPMISSFDEVLVAETQKCIIPLGFNISVLVDIKRDITAMSTKYPFSSILKNRVSASKRKLWLSTEIKLEKQKKERESVLEPIYHELEQDFRKADKGRIILLGDK